MGGGSEWDKSRTSPVGSFKPSPLGLYDMAGNVWQWVQDCYHGSYNGAPTDDQAWLSGDCSRHVLPGGSRYRGPRHLTSAARLGNPTDRPAATVRLAPSRTRAPRTPG